MNSETYYYKKGANQLFSQSTHIFDPTLYNEDDLMYNTDREVFIMHTYIMFAIRSMFPDQPVAYLFPATFRSSQ